MGFDGQGGGLIEWALKASWLSSHIDPDAIRLLMLVILMTGGLTEWAVSLFGLVAMRQ